MFSRGEQGVAFVAAHDSLPVYTTNLRAPGNFEGALPRGVCVRTIPDLTKPRSSELLGRGDTEDSVGMNESMHSPVYLGLEGEVFQRERPPLFLIPVPLVEEAPPSVSRLWKRAISFGALEPHRAVSRG